MQRTCIIAGNWMMRMCMGIQFHRLWGCRCPSQPPLISPLVLHEQSQVDHVAVELSGQYGQGHSTSDTGPSLQPGKVVKDGLKPWNSTTMWEAQKKVLASGFKLAKFQDLGCWCIQHKDFQPLDHHVGLTQLMFSCDFCSLIGI